MARASLRRPEPVPDIVLLELSVAEALMIKNTLGMAYGNATELGAVWDSLDKLNLNWDERKTQTVVRDGKIRITNPA